jgi:hypothetical protein
MNGWYGEEFGQAGQGKRRRGKSGQRVQLEGMYADEWGGVLHLLQGDVFPEHPHMGATAWTYKGSIVESKRGTPGRNGHRTAAGGIGLPK